MNRVRLVVIDGYNVLWGSSRYRAHMDRDIESAREKLINDVAQWRRDDDDVYLVFDAGASPESTGELQQVLGISVIYSPYGEEADATVESIVSGRRDQGFDIVVVTSDSQTQWVTLGRRVTRISAEQFGKEVAITQADVVGDQHQQHMASRIEDRIEPRVKDLLEQISGRNKKTG